MRESHWVKTAVYYAVFITIGLTNAVLGPTLPSLAANTGAVLSEIGFLFTARSFGFIVGSLSGARLFDRRPGHRLMAAMVIILALTLALTPLLTRIWLLTAVLFLAGFAENMIDVGGNTLLVWLHREKVGPYMNGLHFFFGVGAFLSPIVVAQTLLHSGGVTWAYWLLALIILPVSPLLALLPSPTAVTQSTGQQTNLQTNTWLLILIMAFMFLYVGLEIGFGGWLFTYATGLGLANETAAAYLTSVFWGALTVGRLLSIPMVVRLRPKKMLLLNLLGALLSVGVLFAGIGETILLWLGVAGLGLSFAAIFPTTIALTERRMAISGQITGWLFLGSGLGGMVLPWLMGYLLATIAPTAILWFGGFGLILALGLLWLLWRRDDLEAAGVKGSSGVLRAGRDV